MPRMICSLARQLAQAFQPVLRYSYGETLFPIDPEIWLREYDVDADWSAPLGNARYGTTLLRLVAPPPFVPKVPESVVAGNARQLPSGEPPKLTLDYDPNQGIGSSNWATFRPNAEDFFLSFRGWTDLNQKEGQLGLVRDRFRSLLANFGLTPKIPNLDPSQDVANATIYAEVEWAGIFPRIDKARVEAIQSEPDSIRQMELAGADGVDFAPQGPGAPTYLDGYIALTYYVLYPLALPIEVRVDGADVINLVGPRVYEAQWEAITLFLKSKIERDPGGGFADPDLKGRPSFAVDLDDLEGSFDFGCSYVVATRGWSKIPRLERGSRAACVRNFRKPLQFLKEPVELLGSSHPVFYVALGNHANLFVPTEHEVVLSGSGPNFADFANFAGVLLAFAGSLISGGPFGAILLAILAFLIALFLFVYTIVNSGGGRTIQQLPVEVAGEFYLARSDPGVDNVALVPQASTIPSVPSFVPVIRTVNSYEYLGGSLECAPPPFWRYAGHWGAPMAVRDKWDWGDRRVDPYGRSLAYWNAYRLVDAIAGGKSCDDLDGKGTADSFPKGLCKD